MKFREQTEAVFNKAAKSRIFNRSILWRRDSQGRLSIHTVEVHQSPVLESGQMSSHELTEVYAARDEIDAALVQSMLADSNIGARVVGGQIMGAVGEVPAGLPSAPRVWVSDKDANAAVALIREMEEKRRETWIRRKDSEEPNDQASGASLRKQVGTVAALGAAAVFGAASVRVFPGAPAGDNSDEEPAETGEVWKCSNCQEEVTVDFEICWNCQLPRFSDDANAGDTKLCD